MSAVTELAAPLEARCEFADARWLTTAEEYLSSRVAELSSLAAPFSFSVMLLRPPPHLSSGALGLAVTLAPGRCTVRASADPSASLHEKTDYNAAAILASIVYDSGESRARLEREYIQLCGDARLPWRKHGCPDAVAAVLRGLHDHMAIRTVHNPDVAQRAAALGLEQNVDDLNTKGYVRAARPACKSPAADSALR